MFNICLNNNQSDEWVCIIAIGVQVYACKVSDHCEEGQIVAVTVKVSIMIYQLKCTTL